MFDAFSNLSNLDPDENHFDLLNTHPNCPYITIREYNAHDIHQNQRTTFYNFNIRSSFESQYTLQHQFLLLIIVRQIENASSE